MNNIFTAYQLKEVYTNLSSNYNFYVKPYVLTWSLVILFHRYLHDRDREPLPLERNLEMLLLTDPDVHTLANMDKLKFAALYMRDCYVHKNAATDPDVSPLHHALPRVCAETQPDTKKGSNKQSAHMSQHEIPKSDNLWLHNGGHGT